MKGKRINKIFTERDQKQFQGNILKTYIYLEDGSVYELLCFEENVYVRTPEHLPDTYGLTEEPIGKLSQHPITGVKYIYTKSTGLPCGICLTLDENHQIATYNINNETILIINSNDINQDYYISTQTIEEDDYSEKEHIYYGESPIIKSSDIKVVSIGKVYGVNELFDELERKLEFPYFGHNWDALNDLLGDLYWIREKHIIIVHSDFPCLEKKDLKSYLDMLEDNINDNKRYYDGQRLYVVFPEKQQ